MLELTIEPSKMNGILVLTEAITIQKASELREVVLHALEDVNSLYITHDSIAACDISYIQILIAADKLAEKLRKSFKVIGHNPEVFLNLINSTGCESFPWIEEKTIINFNKEGGNE
jgi:anti-anti-sigma regulatory factor